MYTYSFFALVVYVLYIVFVYLFTVATSPTGTSGYKNIIFVPSYKENFSPKGCSDG
jgi:hypothetical protein